MWYKNQWLWDAKQNAPVQFKEINLSPTGQKALFVYFDPSHEFHDTVGLEYEDFREEISPRFAEMYTKEGKILV